MSVSHCPFCGAESDSTGPRDGHEEAYCPTCDTRLSVRAERWWGRAEGRRPETHPDGPRPAGTALRPGRSG